MQNENETPMSDPAETTGADASTSTAATQAAAPNPTTAPAATKAVTVSIPQSTFGKLKAEQRERGKREALAELEAKFKASGFGSLDEALAAAAAVRQQQAKKAEAPPRESPTTSTAQTGVDDRQVRKLQQERERLARQYAQEQQRVRKLQRDLEAFQAEAQLKDAARMAGVQDTDYALRLLQRHLDGKTEAELESFDEGTFFQGLRTKHPYIFGESVVPATTGTGAVGPTAPKASEVSQAAGQAAQVDARKMTPEQFRQHLANRGLSIPVV